MSSRRSLGLRGMLNSLPTYTAPTLPTSYQVAPAPSPERVAAIRSHVFATPVVQEIRRPAAEPLGFAATW